MYQSPIILCAAVVLFHGVSCHLFPAVLDPLTKVDHSHDYKRQSVAQLQECVSAGINVALSGNTPSFISNCSLAATQLITSSSSSAQSQINEIFSSFCIPQCGNITQDVYEDCGFFDVTPPGNKRYLAGLCGTNENGDKCYRMYSKAVTQVVSDKNCFINNEASGGCNCRPLLLSTASNQGCCIDVYHARLHLCSTKHLQSS